MTRRTNATPGAAERLAHVSQSQRDRFAQADAEAVISLPATHSALVFGGDPRDQARVLLRVTDDGMAYCSAAETGLEAALLWCVSVREPNECRAKRGAFWISKIDGDEEAARFGGRAHLFTVYFNDPGLVAVPTTGAIEMLKGRRRLEPLKAALRAVGANLR